MQQLMHAQSRRGKQHQGRPHASHTEAGTAQSEIIASKKEAAGVYSPPQKVRGEDASKRALELGKTKKKPGYPDLASVQVSEPIKREKQAQLADSEGGASTLRKHQASLPNVYLD